MSTPGKPRGRKGGRKKGVPNKATADIKAAFQKHGQAMVKAVLALTKSKDERVRLGAIKEALDRGWGKAVQGVELGVSDAEGDGGSDVLNTLELAMFIGLALRKAAQVKDSKD